MTVCRYYLQGTCRFGDRCRFEHVDPDYTDDYYSSRRQDYGYQDGYRQQGSYQDRYQRYQDPDLSYGPSRFENEKQYYQRYGSAGYAEHKESHDNYRQSNRPESKEIYTQRNYSGNNFSNDRYSATEKQNSRFDSSSPTRADTRTNKYDRSQYEWVSENYKKQLQSQKNYGETSTNKNFGSSKNFSFKDSEVYEAKDQLSEETLFLTEMIKEDMTAWELGNQWPLTCYSPFMKKAGFPGFNDVSFEELRHEAVQAKENNTFEIYIENIAKTILDVQYKRNKLKEPTSQMISIIKKLKNGESLNGESGIDGEYSITSQNTLEEMFAEGSSPFLSQNSAASFSFKSIPDQEQAFKNKASTFSFKSVFDTTTASPNSGSSFSFKLPGGEKLSDSGARIEKLDSGECSIYTPTDKLSVQDKEQFAATTFTLGKIPTVPPPKQMCF